METNRKYKYICKNLNHTNLQYIYLTLSISNKICTSKVFTNAKHEKPH